MQTTRVPECPRRGRRASHTLRRGTCRLLRHEVGEGVQLLLGGQVALVVWSDSWGEACPRRSLSSLRCSSTVQRRRHLAIDLFGPPVTPSNWSPNWLDEYWASHVERDVRVEVVSVRSMDGPMLVKHGPRDFTFLTHVPGTRGLDDYFGNLLPRNNIHLEPIRFDGDDPNTPPEEYFASMEPLPTVVGVLEKYGIAHTVFSYAD